MDTNINNNPRTWNVSDVMNWAKTFIVDDAILNKFKDIVSKLPSQKSDKNDILAPAATLIHSCAGPSLRLDVAKNVIDEIINHVQSTTKSEYHFNKLCKNFFGYLSSTEILLSAPPATQSTSATLLRSSQDFAYYAPIRESLRRILVKEEMIPLLIDSIQQQQQQTKKDDDLMFSYRDAHNGRNIKSNSFLLQLYTAGPTNPKAEIDGETLFIMITPVVVSLIFPKFSQRALFFHHRDLLFNSVPIFSTSSPYVTSTGISTDDLVDNLTILTEIIYSTDEKESTNLDHVDTLDEPGSETTVTSSNAITKKKNSWKSTLQAKFKRQRKPSAMTNDEVKAAKEKFSQETGGRPVKRKDESLAERHTESLIFYEVELTRKLDLRRNTQKCLDVLYGKLIAHDKTSYLT
ncbi:unnamed protein product, partial [Didymodactylos carnosus]